MYTYSVSGIASTSYPHLHELHGIEDDCVLSEHFPAELKARLPGVTGGNISFVYEDGMLHTVSRYKSPELLSPLQISSLYQFTTGQWRDGAGEGFEQTPCYYSKFGYYDSDDEWTHEVYIGPYTHGTPFYVTADIQ